MSKAWIGVDLDGTLAIHHSGYFRRGIIGPPIQLMVERVKTWRANGIEVRILTARADGTQGVVEAIQDWCEEHIGERLPVTNKKDYDMLELWDDRAVQVIPNTGIRVDGGE